MSRRHSLVLSLLLASAACGGDSSGPSGGSLPAELVGTWETNAACAPAGCRLVARSVANPADSLAVLGSPYLFTATLTLRENGAATAAVSAGSIQAPPRTGTARIANGLLIVDYPGLTSDTTSYRVTGDLLQLDYHNTARLVDLTGDGQADEVTLHATFRRRS